MFQVGSRVKVRKFFRKELVNMEGTVISTFGSYSIVILDGYSSLFNHDGALCFSDDELENISKEKKCQQRTKHVSLIPH